MLGDTCDAFCTAYPLLCQDPSNVTLRGNFAAPNGDYYTQVESQFKFPSIFVNYFTKTRT